MQFTQINPYFFACDQKWDDMPEHGDGRLCEACDRVLVDFTGLSEQEILTQQIVNNFKLCGSYTKTQIDRIHRYHLLQESKKKTPWLVSLLMGGSILSPLLINAQSPFPIDSIVAQSPAIPGVPGNISVPFLKTKYVSADSIYVSGVVKDMTSGETLPFAILRIEGVEGQTFSDIEGRFDFTLPVKDTSYSMNVWLEGYKDSTIILSQTNIQNKAIELEPLNFFVEGCRPEVRYQGGGPISVTIIEYSPYWMKYPAKTWLNPANWYGLSKRAIWILIRRQKDKKQGLVK